MLVFGLRNYGLGIVFKVAIAACRVQPITTVDLVLLCIEEGSLFLVVCRDELGPIKVSLKVKINPLRASL